MTLYVYLFGHFVWTFDCRWCLIIGLHHRLRPVSFLSFICLCCVYISTVNESTNWLPLMSQCHSDNNSDGICLGNWEIYSVIGQRRNIVILFSFFFPEWKIIFMHAAKAHAAKQTQKKIGIDWFRYKWKKGRKYRKYMLQTTGYTQQQKYSSPSETWPVPCSSIYCQLCTDGQLNGIGFDHPRTSHVHSHRRSQ